MAVVTVHAAKTNLSQLLGRAEAGEGPVGPECFEPPPDEGLRRRHEGRDDGPSCQSGGA
jgi:hypothetical protein